MDLTNFMRLRIGQILDAMLVLLNSPLGDAYEISMNELVSFIIIFSICKQDIVIFRNIPDNVQDLFMSFLLLQ